MGCSLGLIDHSVSGSLCSCLSGIATCCGDSCCFPVMGDGCEPDHLVGPSFLTNGLSSESLCLGNRVVRMGGIHGNRDNDTTGGEGFNSGESSFHFPVTGNDWTLSHSGGIGLLVGGSSSVRGFLGKEGVVQLRVIKII